MLGVGWRLSWRRRLEVDGSVEVEAEAEHGHRAGRRMGVRVRVRVGLVEGSGRSGGKGLEVHRAVDHHLVLVLSETPPTIAITIPIPFFLPIFHSFRFCPASRCTLVQTSILLNCRTNRSLID